VIKLAITGGSGAVFDIMDGVDNNWFDIDDDELTFKATAFRDQGNNTYHVNIIASTLVNVSTIIGKPKFVFKQAPIKTIAVTVTKTNLNDGGFHITTAANFDTLEKTNKVIMLTATPIRSTVFQLIGFAIVGGADVNKFTLNGSELTFKAPEFQDGSDNTYNSNSKLGSWLVPTFLEWVAMIST
jgi:type II secretory pathway component HofQ